MTTSRPIAGPAAFAPTRRALLSAAALGLAAPRTSRADAPNVLVAFSGAHPPAFALDVLGGGRATLAEAAGRVALVHFFATWCEPCRAELASLDRLATRFREAGLAALAIDVAEVEARVASFLRSRPVRFAVLLDRDRSVTRAWGIEALPSTVVLDRAQRPRLVVRGDLDWERDDMVAPLVALLAETAPTAHDRTPGRDRCIAETC